MTTSIARLTKLLRWLAGIALAAAVATLVSSVVVDNYYGRHGNLARRLDASSTSPRYGMPHVLHVVGLTFWSVGIVAALLALLGWLIMRRRRKVRAHVAQATTPVQDTAAVSAGTESAPPASPGRRKGLTSRSL